jgi:L-lysine exporter family protein LysE/ArgO
MERWRRWGGEAVSLGRILGTVLAFTWLNPHVYLDTVLLLGSVSTQYDGARPYFAAGAMSGSALFFFSLGYGARLLRPWFANPTSWRVLDFLIGCVMLAIAGKLVF